MDPRAEEMIRLLADSVNRAILRVLNDADRGLTVIEIAEQLVSEGVTTAEGSKDDIEKMAVSLYHSQLPKLDEAGLIEYDRDGNVVAGGNCSAVDAEWTNGEVLDELCSRFGARRSTNESVVKLLESREDVYEYGRELADKAEEELFLIYATDDLLTEECLPHAKDAIRRGVEFHAGAKSRDAREFFRDRLPESTIWDPQLDWMYEQSSYPKVSRLIFADRERVIVGLWDEDDDGTKTEVAMIGEGKSNPLVVLVRELLGPRLDHLDYQSDDFLGDLPFET